MPVNQNESAQQGYIGEYMAAFERTESFGLKAPPEFW